MLAALAGGVGAARLLRGLVEVVRPEDVTAVVNTGDDLVVHGLHVSPDLDTVTYTLAGAVDPGRGWGQASETWQAMGALERYRPAAPVGSAAASTWFRLGDRDLATHLFRTQRLAEGATLSEVTAEVTYAWGIGTRLLPMTDSRVETRMQLAGESEPEIGFQEYFVQRRHSVPVSAIRYAGVESAEPAPGVVEALEEAIAVVICPSNPLVSIAPILAVPGLRSALARRRDRVVAVSPIVAGAALKGPADRLLAEMGHEVSVVGVARLYAALAATVVVDSADAHLATAVESEGVRCVVTPAVMHGLPEATALAEAVLAAAGP
ncbi:MAG: 2-phospho-L-lactate transferase [Actinobacteria bacterium]|nr:2-phospho-L-lactate transferase [Actinomycetota bacterium]